VQLQQSIQFGLYQVEQCPEPVSTFPYTLTLEIPIQAFLLHKN